MFIYQTMISVIWGNNLTYSGNTEFICEKQDDSKLIRLSDYEIYEKDVLFVDTEDKLLVASKELLNAKLVGFDSEFMHTFDYFAKGFQSLKYLLGGVSIMQLATNDKKVYIIDVKHLCKSPLFVEFINNLFGDPHITKIGHSI